MSLAAFPPYGAVPHAHVPRRLADRRVRILAAGAVAAVTAAVSLVAVLVRPTTQACGFYCGPHVEAPLRAAATYVNSAHGFSIDYSPDDLQVSTDQPDLVEFQAVNGGPIGFRVVQAASLDAAVTQAMRRLPSSSFQDLQEVGPVRGAEIGYVPGKGTVWSATYYPSDGGGSSPVRIAVIAAQSNGLMVVSTMVSAYDAGNDHAPYGLSDDNVFDYPVSNFHFPGSQ